MTQYVKQSAGIVEYYCDPELKIYHREDGPAVEYPDGTKFWYLNGQSLGVLARWALKLRIRYFNK